jgi:small subunit ribosomal protein S3
MGQKVHPVGIRLGIIKDWTSKWYADSKHYADYLRTDLRVREYVRKKLANASVSRIQIERPANNARVIIHTARPGIVIGKKGEDIDRLRNEITQMMGVPATVSVEEIRKPELDAYLVAESVAQQIERRIMFRRAMKRAVTNTMRLGALGIKINVAGRLNGAEIARSEWYREGRVPLHTLRADIDYGVAESNTTYGVIGVKVWIFKGEVLKHEEVVEEETTAAPKPAAETN